MIAEVVVNTKCPTYRTFATCSHVVTLMAWIQDDGNGKHLVPAHLTIAYSTFTPLGSGRMNPDELQLLRLRKNIRPSNPRPNRTKGGRFGNGLQIEDGAEITIDRRTSSEVQVSNNIFERHQNCWHRSLRRSVYNPSAVFIAGLVGLVL